jgi:hypothetical protein
LMSSSAILHWTLSQSVFVMVVEAVAEDGTIDHQNPEYFTGFSVWPIIVCKWKCRCCSLTRFLGSVFESIVNSFIYSTRRLYLTSL